MPRSSTKQETLRQLAKETATQWVNTLREKWGIRTYRVDRDGTIRWRGQPFALCLIEKDHVMWDALIHSKPPLPYIGIFFNLRLHLYVHLSVNTNPTIRRLERQRSSTTFLTLMVINNLLKDIWGLSTYDFEDLRVHLDSHIDLPLPKWGRINDLSAFLRFPMIDEKTDPQAYTVSLIVEDNGVVFVEAKIPYPQLRQTALKDLHNTIVASTI
ncbi:MAG: hypothetical protein RQ862_03550 [Candidatus Caldarchaeales archaeon]|jgi:hypothetical protein|nr:hypothetical protein [Candidatus Caldarchaeales archaeon]